MQIPNYIPIAQREIGQKEKVGGENPRIIEYDSATSLHAKEDEVPWCSAFVNWVMLKAGYRRTNSAAAKSWLNYGPVTKQFQQYWIVVFNRGSSWQGHVALAMEDKGDKIKVLGGNQGDQVCYALYPKRMVAGYVKPVPTAALAAQQKKVQNAIV
jgi:uncharacterized protein (TIGR02594 family)